MILRFAAVFLSLIMVWSCGGADEPEAAASAADGGGAQKPAGPGPAAGGADAGVPGEGGEGGIAEGAEGEPPQPDTAPIAVVVMASGPAAAAAQDLADALNQIRGEGAAAMAESVPATGQAIQITVDAAGCGGEGDSAVINDFGPGNLTGVAITGCTDLGAAYGVYEYIHVLGVRYLHPEETYFPANPGAPLPQGFAGYFVSPRYKYRGFHEHTQHPIELSDFLLRPGNPEFRIYLSNYLRWLFRNRQNVLFFMMLKTVDLDAWIPYMQDVTSEAAAYGIRLGAVISFTDQQQNAFRLIDNRPGEVTGEIPAPEDQIRAGLDRLAPSGLGYFGLQIGTSEFTKPDEAGMLHWINVLRTHLADKHPQITPYAWIHITCGLKRDDGGYYYHLPLDVPEWGAYVHTTMFYDLEHPAPVYGCENFHHQLDFVNQAAEQNPVREMIYFPESAWWLGFDNNMPLVLPITGWTREYDMNTALAGKPIVGHVTFTSGREWTYWQYDYFLTRATFDTSVTWENFLEDTAMLFENPDAAIQATKDWTALQKKHFLDENPLIYFYLAGELPQDEIGEAVGVLARRPKLSFRKVLEFSGADFAAWKANDLDMLERMAGEYTAVLETLPPAEGASGPGAVRYRELRTGFDIYVRRVQHAAALYRGVAAARGWYILEHAATPGPEATPEAKAAFEAQALAELAKAQEISSGVAVMLAEAEALYRYPVELLARPKPESPTSYKFGYLAETSTAYFWTRRDEQLAKLIDQVFHAGKEEWQTPPAAVFLTDKAKTVLVQPDTPLAKSVLTQFLPALLFGVTALDENAGAMSVLFAADSNANLLPDPGTQAAINGAIAGGTWTGMLPAYEMALGDASGQSLIEATLLDAVFTLEPEIAAGAVTAMQSGAIQGEVLGQTMVGAIVSIGGIDQEGAANLVKQAYGIPATAELPERLPLHFKLRFVQP